MSNPTGDDTPTMLEDLPHDEAVAAVQEVFGFDLFQAHAYVAIAQGEPPCLHEVTD